FGHLLEATRATLRDTHPPSILSRGIVTVFSTPWLLSPLMWGARLIRDSGIAALLAKLPGRAGAPFLMLAATAPGPFSMTGKAHGAAADTQNGGVAGVGRRDAERAPRVQQGERRAQETAS